MCGRRYKVKKSFDEHVSTCCSEHMNGSSVQRAVAIVYDMIHLYKTVECYSRHDRNPNMEEIQVDPETDGRVMEKGWERRPKRGEALTEVTEVDEFKPDIIKWFNIGSACQSHKFSAAKMVQMLHGMYPCRYDLPSEQQVNAVITSLSKKWKEARIEAARKRMEKEKLKKKDQQQSGKQTDRNADGIGDKTDEHMENSQQVATKNDDSINHDEDKVSAEVETECETQCTESPQGTNQDNDSPEVETECEKQRTWYRQGTNPAITDTQQRSMTLVTRSMMRQYSNLR